MEPRPLEALFHHGSVQRSRRRKPVYQLGGFHGRRRQSFRLYPRTAGQRRRMGAGIQGHQPQLHRRNHVRLDLCCVPRQGIRQRGRRKRLQHQCDADGGKQPCARYQRHGFKLGNEDRRVHAELQRDRQRQRADLDRDGVHRRHAEAFLYRDKRTDLFVQHHRRRVGEAVERVPHAENRCGGQLRRKRDPDVYVHEE